MSETKLGWTCAHLPIYIPIHIPIYVSKRFSEEKRQVLPHFLLHCRKQVAKKVSLRPETPGPIWDTFLKSKFVPALVCIRGAAFKFQVPIKPFRENNGISQALELVCSLVAGL